LSCRVVSCLALSFVLSSCLAFFVWSFLLLFCTALFYLIRSYGCLVEVCLVLSWDSVVVFFWLFFLVFYCGFRSCVVLPCPSHLFLFQSLAPVAYAQAHLSRHHRYMQTYSLITYFIFVSSLTYYSQKSKSSGFGFRGMTGSLHYFTSLAKIFLFPLLF
jgi:hypothetical protein